MTSSVQDDPKYQPGPPSGPEAAPADAIVSPDTRRPNRMPPGQARTRKWPVLHWAHVPTIDLGAWRLEVNGLVERPLRFTWAEFQALPRVRVFADFHCVTRWSRLGNLWEGVSLEALLASAGIRPDARHLVATGYDSGWTTNLRLDEALRPDALLADRHDGTPIDEDHGGPVRLIVPHLYAWKSAKWLKSLTLTAEDAPGYWEQLGYHNHGDPWTEERYEEG
ncbi:MAG: sulfite oxidase-like oxidoreductase [Planctomyces sp.]|nr:sulfite oxidase-like oxidoreductase [Planctomyces sp.]